MNAHSVQVLLPTNSSGSSGSIGSEICRQLLRHAARAVEASAMVLAALTAGGFMLATWLKMRSESL